MAFCAVQVCVLNQGIHMMLWLSEYDYGCQILNYFTLPYFISYIVAICPYGWTYRNNKCYIYILESMLYDDAQKYCEERGAILVTIVNHAEENFLKDLVPL